MRASTTMSFHGPGLYSPRHHHAVSPRALPPLARLDFDLTPSRRPDTMKFTQRPLAKASARAHALRTQSLLGASPQRDDRFTRSFYDFTRRAAYGTDECVALYKDSTLTASSHLKQLEGQREVQHAEADRRRAEHQTRMAQRRDEALVLRQQQRARRLHARARLASAILVQRLWRGSRDRRVMQTLRLRRDLRELFLVQQRKAFRHASRRAIRTHPHCPVLLFMRAHDPRYTPPAMGHQLRVCPRCSRTRSGAGSSGATCPSRRVASSGDTASSSGSITGITSSISANDALSTYSTALMISLLKQMRAQTNGCGANHCPAAPIPCSHGLIPRATTSVHDVPRCC